MPNLAYLVLHTVEEAAVGTVHTTAKVFDTSFNVSLTGSLDTTQVEGSELIGKAKAGKVLLKAAEAMETAFFGGAGEIALCVPTEAPTDTSPAQYYNLVGTISRL